MAAEGDEGTVTLTVKTSALDNPTETVVTVPLSGTVRNLKTNIESALADHPPPNEQKLIFAGRLLDDQKLLSDVFCEQDLKLKLTVHLLIRKHISKPETFGGGTMVPRRESVGNSLAKAAVSPSSEVVPDDAPKTPQTSAASALLEDSPASFVSSRLSLSPESISSVPAQDPPPTTRSAVASPSHPANKPEAKPFTSSEEKSKPFAFPSSAAVQEDKSSNGGDSGGKFKFPEINSSGNSVKAGDNEAKAVDTGSKHRPEVPQVTEKTPKRVIQTQGPKPPSLSPAAGKSSALSPTQTTSETPRVDKAGPAVTPLVVPDSQTSSQVLASMQRVIEAQRALNAAREQYVEQQVELRRQMVSSNRMSPGSTMSMPMPQMPMPSPIAAPFMVSPQMNNSAYGIQSPDLRMRFARPNTSEAGSGSGGTESQVATGQHAGDGNTESIPEAAAGPPQDNVPPVAIPNPPARRWVDGRALVMAAKLAFLLFLLGQHRSGARDMYTLIGAGVVIFIIYLGVFDWILNSRFVTSMFTHLDIRPRMVEFDENGRPIPEPENRDQGGGEGARSHGGGNDGNDDEWIEVDQDGNEVNPEQSAPVDPPRILRPVRQAGILKEVEVLVVGFVMSLFPSWDPPE